MAGPAIFLEWLLLLIFFVVLVVLLIITIWKSQNLKISLTTGFLFLLLTIFALNVFYRFQATTKKEAKKFLGDYKLLRLDKKVCDSCKVKLYDSYRYEIIVKGNVVGQGKWSIESAVDIPGYFLELENGPGSVIWEKDRLIDYIDRTKK